ncbi:7968_t:CDS:2, partial [Racocetra fulgida]
TNTNDILIPKKRNTFSTFGKARAFVEKYAAQTNIVTILGRTTRNSEGNGYRQAFFVCEKQWSYNEKNEAYTTKRIGCQFVIRLNYRKHLKEFAITKLCLEHNHVIYPDARKFSINMRKMDQNELGTIKDLHNKGLRTKDIYTVLASVSSKYVYKRDVYNAVGHQHQQKLQGLNDIEMLFKTLEHDENIIASIATKPAYNDECDQDGSFIQAIFWAHQNAFSEFAVVKDVLVVDAIGIGINEFIRAFQKLVYDDLSEDQTEQKITDLWLRFPSAKKYICETWMPHKESLLAIHTKGNMNLDIRSSQRVESLHSQLKSVESRITPIDR